ncbi:hypothetical protein IWW39_002611 [Coemansia spiralis]|uniref:Sorting nexin MVP1 n=1 Tax=Coemansia spiralis TaxID=417178 RepID=A0A9W8GGI1_9FUNG|nr:hypothetical protein IWW39_002611 [Coemansia spiralis]
MDDSHGRAVTRSEFQSQIQHLQTIAIEASNQLRKQCAQVMQTQTIRLEDVTETEIEDIVGLDSCMDELMLCVLYTELRKEVRDITDALVDQQYSLFSPRRRPAVLSPAKIPSESDETGGNGLGAVRRRGLGLHLEESDDDNPPQLSATDTFMTARGAPFFSSVDSPAVASGFADPSSPHPLGEAFGAGEQPMSAPAAPQTTDDTAGDIGKLESRLYEVCIEIDEWRRTRHILDFISEHAGPGGRRRDSRPMSLRSVGISTRLPIEQIIGEARERQRIRASSVGDASAVAAGLRAPLRDAAMPSSLMLSASPPLSRLMQAEREAANLRAPRHAGNGFSSPLCQPTFDSALSPSGQPVQGQLSSLRLIGDAGNGAIGNGTSNGGGGRHRTLADDVRIIGWVTRGSGLDVHTEFKVLVHLTRGENLTVMRRYTDFALLREVLCQRYYAFRKRIPHLPPKKAFGKFEDKFLKERESGLQFFLAYVMLHPVIGCSSIVRQWLEGVPPA